MFSSVVGSSPKPASRPRKTKRRAARTAARKARQRKIYRKRIHVRRISKRITPTYHHKKPAYHRRGAARSIKRARPAHRRIRHAKPPVRGIKRTRMTRHVRIIKRPTMRKFRARRIRRERLVRKERRTVRRRRPPVFPQVKETPPMPEPWSKVTKYKKIRKDYDFDFSF